MSPAPREAKPTPTARTFGWLALGSMAFTVYGSLVPFEARDRPWNEVADAFVWAMSSRVRVESRSDALANLMLGVPLGFALLGLTCVDRPSRLRPVVLGLLFLPPCAAFSAAVEFAQLYFPARTCAASDVLMQASGAAAGMAAWALAGQWLTGEARVIWAGPRIGGSAGRMLVAYLALAAFVQALPLDLTLSPRDVYKTLRDRVWYFPFHEFASPHGPRIWERARPLVEVVGLFLPVGLLAGCLPGRFWATRVKAVRVVGLGLLLGFAMEGIQLFVASRTPSATDAVVGALAVWLGWTATILCRTPARLAMSALAWIALLLLAFWHPFHFAAPAGRVEWLPLLPLEVQNPLYALQDLITKLVLFAPLGTAVAATGRVGSPSVRIRWAIGMGIAVSAAVEFGQMFLPMHTPSVTDVLLGGAGGWVGAIATARARGMKAAVPHRPISRTDVF